VYLLEFAGEDDAFAAAEARVAAPSVRVEAPGVGFARGLDAERARGLAYTRHAGELVGHAEGGVEAALAVLSAASLPADSTVAVRARAPRGSGVDTQRAERELGTALVERGFSVDLDAPERELRAVFSGGRCFLAWGVLSTVRDFSARQPTDRPFFQPGGMDPLLARAVVNLAGVGPGGRFLDPMCGTGGLPIEAALVGADAVASDAQGKMVRGARENLAHYTGGGAVARADATRLPFREGTFDAVAFDAPYGRQSKIETHTVEGLVAGALAEARRVAPRCVLVADRDWRAEAEDAGWEIGERFERRVHRSLVRHVLVLSA
jgi:tRNA (guanine10-N2)-dimethyltransferase